MVCLKFLTRWKTQKVSLVLLVYFSFRFDSTFDIQKILGSTLRSLEKLWTL